ncbi:MAG: TolB protein [Mariprofundaceae bacterium]
MKHRIAWLAALGLTLAGAQGARAEGLLDWLKSHQPVKSGPAAKPEPADAAELLTLEPGETEMFPKVSPDGRHLLVLRSGRKGAAISRRLAENGDPLNDVTEDPRAFDSFAWHGDDRLTFLSTRAGGLGLWSKPVTGMGVLRRIQQLSGQLTQPTLLPDGSIVAVRLYSTRGQRAAGDRKRKDEGRFDSWNFRGFEPHIVRIAPDGSERELSLGANPAVSPDGQRIAFSMAAGRSRHLFVMDADGGNLIQLTSERAVDVQPAWSPDGRWIVFTSNRARPDLRHGEKSGWDVWAVGIDGRNLTQLTFDPARDGAPDVSPDGWVYFHSDRKVGKAEREAHQVRGQTRGFHIWRVRLPASKSAGTAQH